MWFNNKFNKDNTIHFDVNEWVCTDPDEAQFRRKISETEFEYIQLKNRTLMAFVGSFGLNTKHLLETLSDKTKTADWYQFEIDINDYDADELGEYAASYGGDEYLGDSEGAERNQLLAECIFEQDIVFSGDYDY